MSSSNRFPIGPGDRFGGTSGDRFEVLAQVGLGGQAVVFKAQDTRLGRDVAAKISTAMGHGDRRMAMDRFERELQLSARVSHPHVLQVYDCGELPDGSPFVLLEWMEHGSLASIVDKVKDRGKCLPLKFVKYYATALGAALRAVHGAQMIHRDIKPDNVLIGADGVAKLTDFGIAKDISPGAIQLTEVGQTLGTLGFMSPEQLSGLPGPQSDIFSFGVTVYATLMGKMPDQVSQNAIPLGRVKEEAWNGVPQEFAHVLRKCTAFELDDRCQDLDEVLNLLRELQVGEDRRPKPPARKSLPPLPSGAFVTGNPGQPANLGDTGPDIAAVTAAQRGNMEPTRAMSTPGQAAPGGGMSTQEGFDALDGGPRRDDNATRYFPAEDAQPSKGGSRAGLFIGLAVLLLGGGGAGAYFAMQGSGAAPEAAEIRRQALAFDAAAMAGEDRKALSIATGLPKVVEETPEGKLLLAQDALMAGDWNAARGLATQASSLDGDAGALAALVEGAALRLGGSGNYGAAAAAYKRAAGCTAPGCGPFSERGKAALADLCLALPQGSPGCEAVSVPQTDRDRQFVRSMVLLADGHDGEAKAALVQALNAPGHRRGASCLESEALKTWAAFPEGIDGSLRGQIADAGREASRDEGSCRLYGGLK